MSLCLTVLVNVGILTHASLLEAFCQLWILCFIPQTGATIALAASYPGYMAGRALIGVAIGGFFAGQETILGIDGDSDPGPFNEAVAAMEALGFDSVWAGDSVLARALGLG